MCGLYWSETKAAGGAPAPHNQIANVIPDDAWFILPIALIQRRSNVLFPPRCHPRPRALFAA